MPPRLIHAVFGGKEILADATRSLDESDAVQEVEVRGQPSGRAYRSWIAVWVAAAVMLGASAHAQPESTRRALLIGINEYQELPDLRGALNDLDLMEGLPPLGDVQFVTSDGQPLACDGSNRIPMHGGRSQNGVFNVAQGPLGPQGCTPITLTVLHGAPGPICQALAGRPGAISEADQLAGFRIADASFASHRLDRVE